MKTKEELNTLTAKAKDLVRKLAELSEDELKAVIGGANPYDEMFINGKQKEYYIDGAVAKTAPNSMNES